MTTMFRNSPDDRVLNRGAISTPASPAKKEESAHADAETRSASMPFSSVILGLSTTARMRRPRIEKRNRATSPTTAIVAAPMDTSSFRLNE